MLTIIRSPGSFTAEQKAELNKRGGVQKEWPDENEKRKIMLWYDCYGKYAGYVKTAYASKFTLVNYMLFSQDLGNKESMYKLLSKNKNLVDFLPYTHIGEVPTAKLTMYKYWIIKPIDGTWGERNRNYAQ